MKSQVHLCNVLFSISLLAAGFIILSGCDDTPENEARKTNIESINKAQRTIRSSNDNILLKENEIQAAARSKVDDFSVTVEALKERSRTSGQNVAERLKAGESNLSELEAIFSDIEKLRQEITTEGELAFLKKLEEAANGMVIHANQLNELSIEDSQKRLDQARKLLEDAERNARMIKTSRNDMEYLSAPESALGTLQTIYARRNASLMDMAYNNLQTWLIKFNHILSIYLQQNKLASIQETLKPTYMVNLGEGGQTNTINQLVAIQKDSEAQLASVTGEIAKLENEISNQTETMTALISKARQLRSEYLKIIAQADDAKGQERFDLKKAAYNIEIGDDGQGCIYYETQVELAERKLTDLKSKQEYLTNRQKEIAESLKKLTDSIQTLQNSPTTTTAIDTMAKHYSDQAEKSLEELKSFIQSITKAEEEYGQVRVAAIAAYEEARAKFDKAGNGVSGRFYSDYCSHMINTIKLEMAQLWRQDAAYYESILNVMDLDLGPQNEVIRTITSGLFAKSQNLAQQAIMASEDEQLKVEENNPVPGANMGNSPAMDETMGNTNMDATLNGMEEENSNQNF